MTIDQLEKENRRLKTAVERLCRTVEAQRARLNDRVPVNLDTNVNREGVETALRGGIEAHLEQHRGLILSSHLDELTGRLLGELKELNRTFRAPDEVDTSGDAVAEEGALQAA